MEIEVRHHAAGGRYELLVNGTLGGIADYEPRGDVLVFPHTEVFPEHRGKGLGAVLVRGALDDVRRRGERIVATCWYVREFVAGNPEYHDLLAG